MPSLLWLYGHKLDWRDLSIDESPAFLFLSQVIAVTESVVPFVISKYWRCITIWICTFVTADSTSFEYLRRGMAMAVVRNSVVGGEIRRAIQRKINDTPVTRMRISLAALGRRSCCC